MKIAAILSCLVAIAATNGCRTVFVKFPLGFKVNVDVNGVHVHINCHRIIDGNGTIKMAFYFRQLLLNRLKKERFTKSEMKWNIEWAATAASHNMWSMLTSLPTLFVFGLFLSEWCNIALLLFKFFMTVTKNENLFNSCKKVSEKDEPQRLGFFSKKKSNPKNSDSILFFIRQPIFFLKIFTFF